MRRWLWDNRGYRDIWLLIITGLTVWAIFQTFAVSDQSRQSLCTWRADIQRRIDQGTKFLAQHPNGGFGFTATEIRVQLDNQQRAVLALNGLDCPKS